MPSESGDPGDHARSLEEAVDEALGAFPDEGLTAPRDAADYRWLSVGVRLGLEHPDQARTLLELIEDRRAGREDLREGDAGESLLVGVPAAGSPAGSASGSVSSALLARAAALPLSELASVGPEVTFGWAARLTSNEILLVGRVVRDMMAAGSPPDIGRGFGLAWDAGVRLPRHELKPMFQEFAELELTVAAVLAGRDLRAVEPAPQTRGLGALLGLAPRARPGDSEAAAAIEKSGEPGRLGLIALWNVWMAMRYRRLIPSPTFELLVHPWVTAVGPLPEP